MSGALVMADKKNKTVKINDAIHAKLRFLAEAMGIDIGDYVSEKLAPHIAEDMPKAVRAMEQRGKRYLSGDEELGEGQAQKKRPRSA